MIGSAGAAVGIERDRIHRPVGPDLAAELVLRGAEGVPLAQHFHPRAGELQHQLQGVGLHRGAGGDARTGHVEPFIGPPDPLLGDSRQLLIDEHVVVARLGLQRGPEPLLQLPRLRGLQLGLAPGQLGELPEAEDVVVGARRPDHERAGRVGRVGGVEEALRVLRLVQAEVDRAGTKKAITAARRPHAASSIWPRART